MERQAHANPVSERNRLNGLDILRGFAVLAIFLVNVKMMANGFNHYVDYTLWGGEWAQAIGLIHSRLVHGKFVTIFTALFGAGLALLLSKSEPARLGTVLRRLFWLAVFGSLHLVFLREGDILTWYALAGLVAVPFARLSAQTLLIVGLALQIVVYLYGFLPYSEADVPVLWRTGPDAHEDVAVIMLGTLGEQIAARLATVPYYMVDLFILGGVWLDTLGVMLLGMALLKSGFLSGTRPVRHYLLWGGVGFAMALGRDVIGPFLDAESPADAQVGRLIRQIHYLGGALAWSALIVGAVAAGWKGRRLAAVGRTAFTVYILQSAIGLLLFSSLGLGLFGQLSLPVLTGTTVLVWVSFLFVAPLWLSRFRYGPLEWIWRSFTYGVWQPMRKTISRDVSAGA